jgi:hypothetical protein
MAPIGGRASTKALTLAVTAISGLGVAVILVVFGVHQHFARVGTLSPAEMVARTDVSNDVRYVKGVRLRALSPAHKQMLTFTKLGCECTDITKIISADNTWGHYTPKCCNKLKEKTSVDSVLDTDIEQAQADTQNMDAALAEAKQKLEKKLSVVVDAVTLKNGGRPGDKGPTGKKGPQGYVGKPGVQGPRGPPGLTGPRGPKGHRGQVGYRGDTGDIGRQGQRGWEGVPGAPGYIGADGPRGPVGAEGPPGPNGPKGPVGNQGSLGRTGSTGPLGKTGLKGREIIFNGYTASTQCERTRGHNIWYLDRFDVSCEGLLGRSFINRFKMTGKCPSSGLKYERTCLNAGVWNKVGVQGQNVYCNGWLRYGKGDKWVNAKQVGGWVNCNDHLGDPSPGVSKECQCSSNGASGATQCSNHDTGCQCCRHSRIEYMDRQSMFCPNGKALTKFRAGACGSNGLTTRYTCCQPTWGMSSCKVKWTGCQVSDGYPIEYLDRHNIKVCARSDCTDIASILRVLKTLF